MRGLCAVVGGRSVPARRAVVMFDCAAWQCAGVRAYAAIRPSRIWCVHTARQQTSRPTPPAPALAEPWRSSRRTSDDLRCSPSGSYCGTAHPPRTNGMWRRVSTLVSVRRSCPAIAVTGSACGTDCGDRLERQVLLRRGFDLRDFLGGSQRSVSVVLAGRGGRPVWLSSRWRSRRS